MSTVLNKPTCDLEQAKFLLDDDNCVAVRTTATGTIQPSGLQNEGKHTLVSLSSTVWREMPSSSLTDRNAINIQNNTTIEMKVNHGATAPGVGYEGMTIVPNGGERQYAITEGIKIWGRLKSGTDKDIDVEELA